MTRKRRLRIVPVGSAPIPPEVANDLATRLRRRLKLRVTVEAGSFFADPEAVASGDIPGTGTNEGPPSLSSNDIVDALVGRFDEDDSGWVLGLTAHDLNAPGRSSVFGEATLGGRWAVVSAARFGPPDTPSPRLLERVYREAVHELGHLAGLTHCTSGEPCVMQSAGTVSAIDAREADFCPRCDAEFLRKQVEG